MTDQVENLHNKLQLDVLAALARGFESSVLPSLRDLLLASPDGSDDDSDEGEEVKEEGEDDDNEETHDGSGNGRSAMIRLPVGLSLVYNIDRVADVLKSVVDKIAGIEVQVKTTSRTVHRQIGTEEAHKIVTLIMKDMVGGTIHRLVAISKQLSRFRQFNKSDELSQRRDLPATIQKLFEEMHLAMYFDTEDTDIRGIMRAFALCNIRQTWDTIKDNLKQDEDNDIKRWLTTEAIRFNIRRSKGMTFVAHAKAILLARLFPFKSATEKDQARKKFNAIMEDGKLPEIFKKYWGQGSCIFFSYDLTTSK